MAVTLLVFAGYSLGRCLVMYKQFAPPRGIDGVLVGGLIGLLTALSFFYPLSTPILYSLAAISGCVLGYIVRPTNYAGVYDSQSAPTWIPFIPVVVQKIGAYWVRFMVYLLTLGIYYIIVVPYSYLVFIRTKRDDNRVEWIQEEKSDPDPDKPF